MTSFLALLRRDLRLALRQGFDAALAIVFSFLRRYSFPSPSDPIRRSCPIAGGVSWVTALLASLLSLERLFLADYQDGALDLLALAPEPLSAIVLAKVAAHWLTTVCLCRSDASRCNPSRCLGAGRFALAGLAGPGTPTLSLIGAIGAGLALGARRVAC